MIHLNLSKFGDEGLFVSTEIHGNPVTMLVDTGASVTILKREIFETLKPSCPNLLKPVDLNLTTATGEIAPLLGKIVVDIKLGNYSFSHEILVADIQNDGILGIDFLSTNKINVLLSKSCLSVKRNKIPCFHFNKKLKPRVCRIAVSEDIVVPPDTEVIISGKMIDPIINIENGLISAQSNFVNKTGLLLAHAIVKPEHGVIPLRVMNASGEKCSIKKCTVAAKMECVENNTIQTNINMECGEVVVNNVTTSKVDNLPAHLVELFELSTKNLSNEQSEKFKSLLIENQNAFSKDPKDIGTTKLVEHNIDTGDARPIRIPPRRLPLAKLHMAEQEIEEMAKRDIIEPCYGPWSFPVVLITQPKLRFAIDYRLLNKVTHKDSYPLPRIDDTLDALAGASLFSVLDLRSGYWNVNIAEKDRPKTAFSIPGSGLWQFKKMSFGLCNAPATFVRLMERVLRGLSWKICLVYLDDIIVFSKSFDEHLENLGKVIKCLKEADLKINPQKCNLFKDQVKFLGHVVSAEGVATDPSKTESVMNWPTPKNVKHVRAFLGLCSYYRRYVRKFSEIARPLHKLTEANRKFEWTDECQVSFDTLKQALTNAPILSFPTPDEKFILDTDASNEGLGAVLSQVQLGVEKVICYYSKTFSKEERRYCVTRRELLAVVASVKHFHPYLYGRNFLIRSDHGALRWLNNFKNPEGQLARWLEILAAYDFTIEHRPGRIHSNADSLSRRPCCEMGCNYCQRAEIRYNNGNEQTDKSTSETVDLSVCAVTRSQTNKGVETHVLEKGEDNFDPEISIAFEQKQDPILKKLIDWLIIGTKPKWEDVSRECTELKHYWSKWDSLAIKDDILFLKWENDIGNKITWKVVLPEKLRAVALKSLHNAHTSGHLGIKKTLAKVRDRYFWYGLRRDVENWLRNCTVCGSKKGPSKKSRAPLKLYSVGVPMERLAIDVTGPLPRSNKGNKYIVVISDYFTKWTQAFAIKDQEASTIAKILVENVISLFGVPRQLHSDKGSNFESKLFTEVCKLLGIDKTRTTTNRPQSDGMVERMMKTIKEMLKSFIDKNHKNWDELLPLLMMAYRSSIHESTGVSPSRMMLGREITLPVDLVLGVPEKEENIMSTQYAYDLEQCLKYVHEFARDKLKLTGQTMKKYYDHKIVHREYEIGSHVWLHNPISKRGLSRKLQPEWTGPYLVTHKLNDCIYRIQGNLKTKPKVVHHDKMKPYTEEIVQ